METKKQNRIILTLAVLVSVAIWFISAQPRRAAHFESRVFKGTNGWGYEVLVNDTVFIHQESVPALSTHQGFALRKQAEQTAQLVIQKLKTGALPALTKSDLEKITGPDETNNDRQRKME